MLSQHIRQLLHETKQPHKHNHQPGVIKSLIEGMTFSSFIVTDALMEMEESTVKGFARTLPQYQELVRDHQTKSAALKLMADLVQQFGTDPLTQQQKDYIIDQFDELSDQAYGGKFNMGDWGHSSPSSAEDVDDTIPDEVPKPPRASRGASHNASQYEKARQEIAAFDQAPPEERMDRLATAQTQAVAASASGKGSKMTLAKNIFTQGFGTLKPSEIIKQMMDEIGLSKPHATTYYYTLKKQQNAEQDVDQIRQEINPTSGPRPAAAPSTGSVGGINKTSQARIIFKEEFGSKRPSEIIKRIMDELSISRPHATTYYYKFKKEADGSAS